jgi:Cytochrome c554 and c-prime
MRPTTKMRRPALILFVLIAACYPGWLAIGPLVERPAEAQEKDKEKSKKEVKDDPITKTPLYTSVKSCARGGCHGGPPTEWPLPLLVSCNEYTVWEKEDKHADAYNVLLRDRGKRMSELLRYDVTTAPGCLSCHAVVIKDAVGFKNGKEVAVKAEATKGVQFSIADGVSCAVCHGKYKEWVVAHGDFDEAPRWRKLERLEKESRFGMTDLWDPVTRTKLCASCHIGNLKEGKEVTHDMYAAGHPPLPGFEVAMFSDEMPRHWQYLGEKKKTLRKYQGYDGKTREQTQLLLVGSAVSLGESLRLIAAQAAGAQKADGDPELAMFDCYSCHHEIRSPSWRQTRPPVGKVGRVPMRTWPIDLVRLSVRHLAKDDAGAKADLAILDAHMIALQKAFTAKQLGDAPKIIEEANLFAKWADKLAVELQKSTVDEAATKKLLGLLPATFAKETPDYDSARQIAWGYEVLSRDLGMTKGKEPPALAELGKYLDLRLPKGRMKDGKSSIEKELGGRMRQLYDYEPGHFRKLLSKLGARE